MTDSEEKPRILGIDYGHKRIGLAVSDPFGHFAVGLDTLECTHKTDVVGELLKRMGHYEVSTVVLGLPLNMNGSEGPKAQTVRELAAALQERLKEQNHKELAVTFLDERLTSVLAHQTLLEQGISPSRNRGAVDQAAAKRLVQDFLDRQQARQDRAAQPT